MGKAWLFIFILSFQSCFATAAPQEDVYFAGSSFLADAVDIANRFPLTAQVLGHGSALSANGPFEKRLRALVLAAAPLHLNIANRDATTQGDSRKGSGKALSLAFSHEGVEMQELDDKIITVYDLSVQVLFFDYSPTAQHLLASYPVRVRHTDLTLARPSREHQLAVIRSLLYSDSEETGLLQAWVRKMSAAEPKGGDNLVAVRPADFEPKAFAHMPDSMERGSVGLEVAQFLEAVISEEWKVPMIPVTVGQAIKGKMVQVFANGDAAEFELPPPSFVVGTTIRDFRKVSAPVAGGERVAYGAFITSTVDGPLERLLELRMKDVGSVTHTERVRVRLDDWSQFQTVLKSMLVRVTKQVLVQDRGWIAENIATANASDQLQKVKLKVLAR